MTISLPKGTDEDADVNPFSKQERDLIIQTFASDRYYSYYTLYVQFLFFTGCRPSEAIALIAIKSSNVFCFRLFCPVYNKAIASLEAESIKYLNRELAGF
jgi:hypothetical protein